MNNKIQMILKNSTIPRMIKPPIYNTVMVPRLATSSFLFHQNKTHPKINGTKKIAPPKAEEILLDRGHRPQTELDTEERLCSLWTRFLPPAFVCSYTH